MCLTVTFHIPGPLRDLLLVALSSKVVCYATEVVRQDTTSCARTMDEVDWSQSGSTCVRIDRRVAEILARKGGFIIAGTNEPDLGAMFAHFGTNCLSAFRIRFAREKLDPCERVRRVFQGWGQEAGDDGLYVGQFQAGKRHGVGFFLDSTGNRAYQGEFVAGHQSGHGVLLAPMGESYAGEFVNGTPCGHGVYVYPGLAEHTPESTSSVSPAVPRRCRHKGAFNGAPAGPGVLEWSNGKAEWAVWRGLQALERLSQTDVRLHATLAHAEDAHDIARSSQKRARDALIACVKEGRVTRETALRVMLHDTTCDRILI